MSDKKKTVVIKDREEKDKLDAEEENDEEDKYFCYQCGLSGPFEKRAHPDILDLDIDNKPVVLCVPCYQNFMDSF